jgi:hypothetical protein
LNLATHSRQVALLSPMRAALATAERRAPRAPHQEPCLD